MPKKLEPSVETPAAEIPAEALEPLIPFFFSSINNGTTIFARTQKLTRRRRNCCWHRVAPVVAPADPSPWKPRDVQNAGRRPLTAFHRTRTFKTGLYPQCKVCRKKRAADYYRRCKEQINKRNTAW